MEMMLTVQDLTKRYHDFKALDHFSMNVEKGAIYGFVGRNGAGKTTLIRTICGLQAPSQGTYTLLGRKHNDPKIAKSRRKMGAVIETPSLYRELNARENLEVQLRMLGLAESAEIDRLLALVGLSEAGRKKVKDFSLGMRQRLAMAVALVLVVNRFLLPNRRGPQFRRNLQELYQLQSTYWGVIRRSLRQPVDPALFSELLSQFHMVYHEAAQYIDQLPPEQAAFYRPRLVVLWNMFSELEQAESLKIGRASCRERV